MYGKSLQLRRLRSSHVLLYFKIIAFCCWTFPISSQSIRVNARGGGGALYEILGGDVPQGP